MYVIPLSCIPPAHTKPSNLNPVGGVHVCLYRFHLKGGGGEEGGGVKGGEKNRCGDEWSDH